MVCINDLMTAAERFEEYYQRQEIEQIAAIRDAAMRVERSLIDEGDKLFEQLVEQLKPWDQLGIPPDFVQIAGQSHLEKPLNRLLGWWARPESEHGLSTEFLKRLAMLANVKHQKLFEDLERGEKPVVWVEQAVDESGKEPDLLVETRHAVLLLENKLGAPESGDQYGPYMELLKRYAGPNREIRAILCASEDRSGSAGEGWRCILHRDIAQVLDELACLKSAPMWGRISAYLCARSFYHKSDYDRVKKAQMLIRKIELECKRTGQIAVQHVIGMRQVCKESIPDPVIPWGELDEIMVRKQDCAGL